MTVEGTNNVSALRLWKKGQYKLNALLLLLILAYYRHKRLASFLTKILATVAKIIPYVLTRPRHVNINANPVQT